MLSTLLNQLSILCLDIGLLDSEINLKSLLNSLHPDYCILLNANNNNLLQVQKNYRIHSQIDSHTYCVVLSRKSSTNPLPPAKAKWIIYNKTLFLEINIIGIMILVQFVSYNNLGQNHINRVYQSQDFVIIYSQSRDTYKTLEEINLDHCEQINPEEELDSSNILYLFQNQDNRYKATNLYPIDTQYLSTTTQTDPYPAIFMFSITADNALLIAHLERSLRNHIFRYPDH